VGAIPIAQGLIKAGASLEVVNSQGKTPLHESLSGEYDMLQFLLAQGAEVDAPKRGDWTCLHVAAGKGSLAVLRSLLAYGADPLQRTRDGRSPLHLAAAEGHLEVARILLSSAPTAATLRTQTDRLPVHAAALAGHADLAINLLRAAPDTLMAKDSSGTTPLLSAVASGNLPLVQDLLHHWGLSAQKDCDVQGRNWAHLAAMTGKVSMLEEASRHGVPLDLPDIWDHWTPMHYAVRYGRLKAVSFLLAAHIDLSRRDRQGRSYRDIAKMWDFAEVDKMLEEAEG
ncbi:ankyrin repeat-containing domain protein, partial [Piptocephalis cylindrospora]